MAKQTKDESKDSNTLKIQYQKGRHYRTVFADGAWAGVTPRTEIQFTLYKETLPSPEVTIHEVTPEGGLGKELERVQSQGLLRETEVNVVMSITTAMQFVNLLNGMIQQVHKFQQESAKKKPAKKKGN